MIYEQKSRCSNLPMGLKEAEASSRVSKMTSWKRNRVSNQPLTAHLEGGSEAPTPDNSLGLTAQVGLGPNPGNALWARYTLPGRNKLVSEPLGNGGAAAGGVPRRLPLQLQGGWPVAAAGGDGRPPGQGGYLPATPSGLATPALDSGVCRKVLGTRGSRLQPTTPSNAGASAEGGAVGASLALACDVSALKRARSGGGWERAARRGPEGRGRGRGRGVGGARVLQAGLVKGAGKFKRKKEVCSLK